MSNPRTIALIMSIFILWSLRDYIGFIISIFITIFVLRLLFCVFRWWHRIRVNHSLESVDAMDGLVFEEFVAQLLRSNGYSRVRLTETYDYGIDILARKDGVRWGIQVKRNRGQVKVEAVRQAVAGLKVYNCDKAMVITNSHFGRYATVLAKANDCVLIDRSELYKLMR